MGQLFINPQQPFYDDRGRPLKNGRLVFGEVNKDPLNFPRNVTNRAGESIGNVISLGASGTQPNDVYLIDTQYSLRIEGRRGYYVQVFDSLQGSAILTDDDAAIQAVNPLVLASEQRLIGTGSRIWPETGNLANGNTVPSAGGTVTHVRFGDELYALNPVASGVVSNISAAGATIGATDVAFEGALNNSLVTSSGTVARSLKDRFAHMVNVLEHGATGDGTTDDTAAVQRALNAAAASGASCYFPTGRYSVSQVDIPSDLIIFGDGFGSVVIRRNLSVNNIMFRVFGTSNNPDDNVKNVVFTDIQMLGQAEVGDGTVDEAHHLCIVQGGTNIYFHRCYFTRFEGVAIGVRAGNNGFFNRNINVTECVFDGVIKHCQNAIAILSVAKMVVDNNVFKRCTAPDQPGAIDLEPNPQDATYFELLDITVSNNEFDDIGGNRGAIALLIPITSGSITNQLRNLKIFGNTIKNCSNGIALTHFQSADPNEFLTNHQIRIYDNDVSDVTNYGFWLYGLRGLALYDNTFTRCGASSRLGWLNAGESLSDVRIFGNTFEECGGTAGGTGINVYRGLRILFDGNTFDDCGSTSTTFGVGINFANGVSNEVGISNNVFLSPTGRMTGAITRSGGTEVNVNTDMNTNTFNGLSYDGLSSTLNADTITASVNLADSDFGKTYMLDNAAGFTVTLPLPRRGLMVTFVVATATTASYRIVTNGGDNIIYGVVTETTDANSPAVSAADTISFSNTAGIGDRIEFASDGARWYINGVTQANFGIGSASS